MVNKIQIKDVTVLNINRETEEADFLVHWYLTDSPELVNTDFVEGQPVSTPVDIYTFGFWPEGIDFT
jgi:hypothetical protein